MRMIARAAQVTIPILVLLAAAAPVAAQTAGSRVLVMPFAAEADAQAPGGTASARWLGEAASVLLADELAALGLGALAREDRVAVFDRLQLPMSSELSRATMIRIGELIGASEVIYGEIHLGAVLRVRVRTIRVDPAQHLEEITGEAPLTDIFGLFGRIGDRVVRASGRLAPPAVKRPTPMPLDAFENYMKGLVAATPAAQQRFLEAAMAQVPHDGRVLIALWRVYTDQGQHDKALAAVSAVLPESPVLRRARFSLALSLIELRRFDGAFKELTALHSQEPAAALSNALGIVQLRRGTLPPGTGAAADYFQRAVQEEPGAVDLLFNLGYARATAGDAAGAVLWLREAVRHDATDGDAHLVMSALLATTGRNPEAQRELELARLLGTSLESLPAAPPALPPGLERVRADLEATGPRLATAITTPAQRDQRETALFHLDRGRRLAAESKDREAAAELRRAIYLAPYEDEPHLLLGGVHQRGGRLAEAIDEFKIAIWCRETAAARLALAAALLEAGERDAARQEAQRALTLAPNSEEARDLLRKIGGNPVLTS